MIIEPRMRGFICLTAHPDGAAQNVKNQIAYIKSKGPIAGAKKVLVIGASTGLIQLPSKLKHIKRVCMPKVLMAMHFQTK